jgi:hypothetical protein
MSSRHGDDTHRLKGGCPAPLVTTLAHFHPLRPGPGGSLFLTIPGIPCQGQPRNHAFGGCQHAVSMLCCGLWLCKARAPPRTRSSVGHTPADHRPAPSFLPPTPLGLASPPAFASRHPLPTATPTCRGWAWPLPERGIRCAKPPLQNPQARSKPPGPAPRAVKTSAGSAAASSAKAALLASVCDTRAGRRAARCNLPPPNPILPAHTLHIRDAGSPARVPWRGARRCTTAARG